MTAEQLVAVIGALTALVVAVGTTFVQIRGLRRDVQAQHETMNGRMNELVQVHELAAQKIGELEGRDFMTRPRGPTGQRLE